MEGNTCHCVQKLRPVPTGTPNIQSLQHWGRQLKGQWRRTFERKYGNLLGLVNIEVQPAALSALTQYYDPSLGCFTFHGFQLAPTLEEYERLIGIPYDKSPPYLFRGHYPSWALVARLLKRTRCPIEDHYWSCVKPLTKAEWTARLDEATKRSIRWYPQWNEREDVIIRCGGFPNIPLIDTQGAINYIPELTLRQAGYPTVLPPSEEAVAPFILHGLGIQEGEYLKKIHQA
ncbi:hypothetical protein CR513_03014, partial [Mucuna pruriens]